MTEEIWRKPRVLAAIGMGSTWLYQAISAGKFPKPVRLGARAVGWRRSDVEAWLNALVAGQSNGAEGERPGHDR